MPPIDVVCDASVVIKWFHSDGESEFEAARQLLDLHGRRALALHVLDLTAYEVGNALVRGRGVGAPEVSAVLSAMSRICDAVAPTSAEFDEAARLSVEHGLTLYDAAYAGVAIRRGGRLVTFDQALLESGLGLRPTELIAAMGS